MQLFYYHKIYGTYNVGPTLLHIKKKYEWRSVLVKY